METKATNQWTEVKQPENDSSGGHDKLFSVANGRSGSAGNPESDKMSTDEHQSGGHDKDYLLANSDNSETEKQKQLADKTHSANNFIPDEIYTQDDATSNSSKSEINGKKGKKRKIIGKKGTDGLIMNTKVRRKCFNEDDSGMAKLYYQKYTTKAWEKFGEIDKEVQDLVEAGKAFIIKVGERIKIRDGTQVISDPITVLDFQNNVIIGLNGLSYTSEMIQGRYLKEKLCTYDTSQTMIPGKYSKESLCTYDTSQTVYVKRFPFISRQLLYRRLMDIEKKIDPRLPTDWNEGHNVPDKDKENFYKNCGYTQQKNELAQIEIGESLFDDQQDPYFIKLSDIGKHYGSEPIYCNPNMIKDSEINTYATIEHCIFCGKEKTQGKLPQIHTWIELYQYHQSKKKTSDNGSSKWPDSQVESFLEKKPCDRKCMLKWFFVHNPDQYACFKHGGLSSENVLAVFQHSLHSAMKQQPVPFSAVYSLVKKESKGELLISLGKIIGLTKMFYGKKLENHLKNDYSKEEKKTQKSKIHRIKQEGKDKLAVYLDKLEVVFTLNDFFLMYEALLETIQTENRHVNNEKTAMLRLWNNINISFVNGLTRDSSSALFEGYNVAEEVS